MLKRREKGRGKGKGCGERRDVCFTGTVKYERRYGQRADK